MKFEMSVENVPRGGAGREWGAAEATVSGLAGEQLQREGREGREGARRTACGVGAVHLGGIIPGRAENSINAEDAEELLEVAEEQQQI